MIFRVQCQPPSVNERDKSRKRSMRQDMIQAVRNTCRGQVDPDGEYEFHLTFHGAYRKKDGTLRKSDPSNRVKGLQDAVCAALGFDDSRIVSGSYTKIHDSDEFVEIRLERVDLGRVSARGRHGIA